MFIALMICIVIAALALNGFHERKVRRLNLQRVAKELGFDYQAEPDKLSGQEILNNLISFNEKSVPCFEDLMCGIRRGYRCNLIKIPGPRGGSMTMICVYLNVQKLPPFAILKTLPEPPTFSILKNQSDRMSSDMEYVMISKLNTILSKHKVLTDRAAKGVIDLPESFLDFFASSPEYCCEYHSGKLLVFRSCVVISPDEVSECLDSAVRLAVILDGIQN